MKRNAFTLIELLVVIAIIAVLAAIAIPVYGSAMEKARVTQDGSNMRQIGIGIQAYLNDHNDDMFPSAGTDKWPVVMHARYVTDWKAYHSPFDRVPAARLVDVGSSAPAAPVSYGVNDKLLDVSSSKFASPSELIMMAPSHNGGAVIQFTGTSATDVKVTANSNGSTRGGTHQNRSRINALFADAHVANMLYTDFTKSTGDERRRWFPEETP
jgi:prepilin-type N-terminal cleavage/methylation domain-containing protein/prepilin-type processing-associated H-X9-DG protein